MGMADMDIKEISVDLAVMEVVYVFFLFNTKRITYECKKPLN